MQVVKWPSHVFRVFGIANFLLVGAGLLFLSTSVVAVGAGTIGNTSEHPYFLLAFWTMVAINFMLLALLILGGIRLWQLKIQGVAVCNGVFVAEFVYFMTLTFLWRAVPPSLSLSIAAATGVGSMGLSPQLICGYPLVGLVCLNLARQRVNAASQILEQV